MQSRSTTKAELEFRNTAPDPLLKKRRRWDVTSDEKAQEDRTNEWDVEKLKSPQQQSTPSRRSKWDMTPQMVQAETPSRKSRWDQTPIHISNASDETPKASSRWDQTPVSTSIVSTPSHASLANYDTKNLPLTDSDLDALLPSEGYVVVDPPADYIPIHTPSRKLTSTPSIHQNSEFFLQPESTSLSSYGYHRHIPEDLPFSKAEDFQYFSRLLDGKSDDEISVDEAKERKILKFLLRIKNGSPQMRKSSMKLLIDRVKELDPSNLFNLLLPLLMSPTLEEQERHLFVKVIDKVLYKLDDSVRPYVHKILTVLQPMLIDENYFARVEAREIISNLSKAAGLPTMISTIRPDIDHPDEYVRNTTARSFAVVAAALGIPSVLPFLKAVTASKKSWQARHTGLKIIQQMAILMGVGILPHLTGMIDCIKENIQDEQPKVRTMAALAIASLAESCSPHGIESFQPVIESLWKGIRHHRGKGLAAFIKAVGFIVPLMDTEYATSYCKEVLHVLVREFSTPDEEMKKIILKVLKQLTIPQGSLSIEQVREEVLPKFFDSFWIRRMALDKRNYRAVIECTVQLVKRVGVKEVIDFFNISGLKDESESFRKMVLECLKDICTDFSKTGQISMFSSIDQQSSALLVDGLMHCFQEASTDDPILMESIKVVFDSLANRMKPFLPSICNTILWRISNKSSLVRMHAMDLIGIIAQLLNSNEEFKLLKHMCTVLYESLGEEYPEVLGSILSAYKNVIIAVGVDRIEPSCKEILPRLTPILRNRNEKVQEACVELVGIIVERCSECASPREWMRICFELLDILKSPRKSIRRSCINTFGWIARAIGPQDVLVTLLNNLKVQERTNRISTTIAIAVVAEICGPFTVLPALLNEYRVPELNVQNGVLKSLAFLYEYIGELAKDYVYPVVSLLEDALADRDLVHRQIASSVVKHLALSIVGSSCSYRDALIHFLNYVWPDCLETSPHMVMTFFDALDGLRVALGPGYIMQYVMQGLAHPARRIRDRFWTVYNQIYIGAQHSLVAFYPVFVNYKPTLTDTVLNELTKSAAKNDFFWQSRSELELFI